MRLFKVLNREVAYKVNMNEEKFKKMVNEYSKLIFTVCYRLTNDYHEAENLTQETFISAYKANEKFIGDNYKAWLVKIASNKCKDYLKSAYIKRNQPVAVEDLHHIPDNDNPQELAITNEGVDRVREACDSLIEPYKTVAILHFLEEKSFDEVAQILHRPIKTVQTQIYRARDKLKKLLEEEKQYE